MKRALEVFELVKVFNGMQALRAVDGVSFSIGEGTIVGLLGPNGAGKSTTIQMLMGTLSPDAGIIRYFGRDFSKHRSSILEQVGFASGYGRLPHNLSVLENLSVYGRLFGLKAFDRKSRIVELLKRFGAYHLKHKIFRTLSAGESTRVMLVKAFLGRPRLVLLDEPTAALDPDVCVEVRAFVKEQRNQDGVTILYTSHNMAEVADICDRVIFLKSGRVIAEDSPILLARGAAEAKVRFEVRRHPERLRQLLVSTRLVSREEGAWFEVELAQQQVAELVRKVVEMGVEFTDVEIRRPTLEDFFLKISALRSADNEDSRFSSLLKVEGGKYEIT